MRRRIFLLFPFLLLFFGCSDDDIPSAPDQQVSHIIHFYGLPTEIIAPTGVDREFDFEVFVRDSDGKTLQDTQIALSVPAGSGTISPLMITTGSSGRASANYTVSMPDEGMKVHIKAETELASETANINLVSKPAPHRIHMRIDSADVIVAPAIDHIMNIDLTVVDSLGVGVEGVNPAVELKPLVDHVEVFGYLSDPPVTNTSGNTSLTFNTGGGTGRQFIRCWLPAYEGGENVEIVERLIEVKTNIYEIGDISLTISPDYLDLRYPDSLYVIGITARVVDSYNNSWSEIPVNFSSEHGIISGSDITDELGSAHARFSFIASEDWPAEFEEQTELEVEITASVPGTQFSASRELRLERGSYGPGELTLSHSVEFIFADNGFTADSLTAVLKDSDKQIMRNKEIIFVSTHGTVGSPVKTDSFGVARSVFKDSGVPSYDNRGNIVPAIITAKYNPMSLTASVGCEIRERNPVNSITLISELSGMQAGSSDSSFVRATCFLQNGAPAPDCTLVNFQVDNGRFSSVSGHVSGGFGVVENYYIAGNAKGRATLQAWVNNGYETVFSNEEIIALSPGPPDRIYSLDASPGYLITNDPEASSTITATVIDEVGNAVNEGILVNFETTLGVLSRTASTTNEDGQATTTLRPGISAGIARVTAIINAQSENRAIRWTEVIFIAGDPNSITLEADPTEIGIAGVAGNETSTVKATLFDPNNNRVETAHTVVFQLIEEPPEPLGCNINNSGQIDSAQTSGGVALVSVNSGTEVGVRLIRAYTWRDSTREDTVSATIQIIVIGGHPYSMEISYGMEGFDAGAGMWAIEMAAMVRDLYANPVVDGYPVVFSLSPDIATIDMGFTGNEDMSGNTRDGIAFTTLLYRSSNTFDTLDVEAVIRTQDGELVANLDEFVLPLQDGSLSLSAEPERWDFSEDGDTCSIRLWTTLRDGHQVLIGDVPVRFHAGQGWLEEGEASNTMILRGTIDDFIGEVANRSEARVEAHVDGYEDVDAFSDIIFER